MGVAVGVGGGANVRVGWGMVVGDGAMGVAESASSDADASTAEPASEDADSVVVVAAIVGDCGAVVGAVAQPSRRGTIARDERSARTRVLMCAMLLTTAICRKQVRKVRALRSGHTAVIAIQYATCTGDSWMLTFEILGEITDIEIIATGRGVKIRRHLDRTYGRGRWRKMKGHALVRLADDTICEAELHWYEAHGIGRKDFKVKRIIQ